MKLRFTKMQGAGNDFVMLNGVTERIQLTPAQLRRLADRRFGAGADQILLVEPPTQEGLDFRYRIFNSDGGEVEQCGNGARCFVNFVRDQGLTAKTSIRVETLSGIIEPTLQSTGEVTVDMGAPRFDPESVPFEANGLVPVREGEDQLWPLQVNGETAHYSVLSMGNPHAVRTVDDVERAPVTTVGARIERDPRFPERVNVGFMQVHDAHRIALRVWERGVGETLACGTGACAAAVAGMRRGLLESPVRVQARGGILTIDWRGREVLMTGPAETVYTGEIEL